MIEDQIWFLETSLRSLGIAASNSSALQPDKLNVLLEAFNRDSAKIVGNFCRTWRKMVVVIMSEHIESDGGAIFFNGEDLANAGYIENKADRFFWLAPVLENAVFLATLGEFPVLATHRSIWPEQSLFRIPYPRVVGERDGGVVDHDIVFTGALTDYRKSVLEELSKRYSVLCLSSDNSSEARRLAYRRARVAVNIPQASDWRWTSPMRFIYGLRCGVATVELNRLCRSRFSNVVGKAVDLESAILDPKGAFDLQLRLYSELVGTADSSTGLFEQWAYLEGL